MAILVFQGSRDSETEETDTCCLESVAPFYCNSSHFGHAMSKDVCFGIDQIIKAEQLEAVRKRAIVVRMKNWSHSVSPLS